MADPTPPAPTAKPVHTIVLDAGPILKNTPPLSTLLAQSETLLTTPSVIGEIRDPDARARVETLYLPFVTQRAPAPANVAVLAEFARKTGDRAVLSKTDIEVLALAYEVECERNGGDWRLRSVPGQRGVNGRPPVKEGEKDGEKEGGEVDKIAEGLKDTTLENGKGEREAKETGAGDEKADAGTGADPAAQQPQDEDDGSDSDGGWITPSNMKKRQVRDEAVSMASAPETKTMQAACITTDFAVSRSLCSYACVKLMAQCQNVLLQMNLNLLSTSTMQRIRHLKSFIKRCHACFLTTKDMNKQFCPRCGNDTLTRVSCTTEANGQFKMHLKKNMQWNNRGNRYSIPKPMPGNSSGKWKGGGGKGGWGNELVLAEDQKEYVRAVSDENRRLRKEKDLMDQDYLPGILSGERSRQGGRIRVGAGRSVNSRKR